MGLEGSLSSFFSPLGAILVLCKNYKEETSELARLAIRGIYLCCCINREIVCDIRQKKQLLALVLYPLVKHTFSEHILLTEEAVESRIL